MKKLILSLCISIYYLSAFTQITFEKGYFITNSDKRIDCLIKNMDWLNNPSDFEYKIGGDGEINRSDIEKVKEFGIVGYSKYVRYAGRADLNLNEVSNLTYDKKPVFKHEVIFLKELISGEANLFEYRDNYLWKFFISTSTIPSEQLISKSYKNENDEIKSNNRYKTQLYNYLKCKSINLEMVEKLKYEKNELIDFFKNYNSCRDNLKSLKVKNKNLFHLNIRPGFQFTRMKVSGETASSRDVEFDVKGIGRVGLELEFVQNFKKGKWSYLIEPTFQTYNVEKETERAGLTKVAYKSFELPVGVRYYAFLSENSQLFFNASFVFDFSWDSRIEYEIGSNIEIVPGNSIALGMGYKFMENFAAEFRLALPRSLARNDVFFLTPYNYYAIILGYSIL